MACGLRHGFYGDGCYGDGYYGRPGEHYLYADDHDEGCGVRFHGEVTDAHDDLSRVNHVIRA